MTVIFARDGEQTLMINPIPGTLRHGGGHDDRGGRQVPNVRAGLLRQGSLQCLVRDEGDQSFASLRMLRSPVGPGDVTVSGDPPTAVGALVDLSIQGDALQIATITWKGSRP